ncbi:MAG: L,D-transpeptidase family protein [Lachnospiraceae bacterium]|nr:L,D-transpeptidase family protein [Lachnospiraceae bacterium]
MMESFKKFIIRNRHIAALTIGISVMLMAVFSLLAVFILDMPEIDAETFTEKPTSQQASLPKDTSSYDETDTYTTEIIVETFEPETTPVQTLPTEELPYLIMVNRVMNCVTIYTKDESGQFTVPVKAMTCSCGRDGKSTPLGTYTTSDQFKWAVMADNTRAQYVYRFNGPYLFHSVPYYSATKNDLETEEFNKLGSSASMGCVRLCVADVLWIYENCPVNTTVIIYDDPSSPGPLGKPDTIKIPLDSPYKGWDPTDPDPENPWHNYSASITAKEPSITINTGSSAAELISHFSVKDTCGNEIPEKAVLEGNYNLNIAGTYNITISVTDAIGSMASLDVTITVTERPTETATETTAPTSSEDTSSTNVSVDPLETTTSTETSTENSTNENTSNETTTPASDETSSTSSTSPN